ncbi:hypothetical protein LJC58_05925 [Lachnospiraceae bacterium OttesenSCG-928-D06]|nr:hypothetical protein [Lachnospiraceae bacterium OttesenSCG-928-D06]
MMNVMDEIYFDVSFAAAKLKNKIKTAVKEMHEDEKGGTATVVVEIVMVGMILVLGFAFRKQIGALFADLWKSLVIDKDESLKGNVGSGGGTFDNPFEN